MGRSNMTKFMYDTFMKICELVVFFEFIISYELYESREYQYPYKSKGLVSSRVGVNGVCE